MEVTCVHKKSVYRYLLGHFLGKEPLHWKQVGLGHFTNATLLEIIAFIQYNQLFKNCAFMREHNTKDATIRLSLITPCMSVSNRR